MKLEILSPAGLVTDTETGRVFLPGAMGEFEVLRNHAPLISTLVKGVIRYEEGGSTKELAVNGGFVKVCDNVISVCVEQ